MANTFNQEEALQSGKAQTRNGLTVINLEIVPSGNPHILPGLIGDILFPEGTRVRATWASGGLSNQKGVWDLFNE